MENLAAKENVLIIKGKTFYFEYPIYRTERYKDFIIVLLEVQGIEPKENYYELYSVTDNGKVKWRMQDPAKSIGGFEPCPIVEFVILDGSVVALDSSFRKFIVDEKDGKITGYHLGKW